MNLRKCCLMFCVVAMLTLLQAGMLMAQENRELEGFFAEWVCGTDTILVTWETADETDTLGFHIWRSKEVDGVYTRITDELAESSGGENEGAVYTYVDDDDQLDRSEADEEGERYYYRIEELRTGDVQIFHGPERAWDLCDDDDDDNNISCFVQTISGN